MTATTNNNSNNTTTADQQLMVASTTTNSTSATSDTPLNNNNNNNDEQHQSESVIIATAKSPLLPPSPSPASNKDVVVDADHAADDDDDAGVHHKFSASPPAIATTYRQRRVVSLRKLHFYVATLTYSLNVITVWRLPYIYSRHGAAFLIPLTVCALFITCPLLCCELFVGQLVWSQSFLAWPKLHPALCGLGLSTFIFMLYVTLYSSTPVAWSFAICWHAILSLFNSSSSSSSDNNNNNSTMMMVTMVDNNQSLAVSKMNSGGLPWIARFIVVDNDDATANKLIGPLYLSTGVDFFYQQVLTAVKNIQSMEKLRHYFVCEVLIAMVAFWLIVFFLLLVRRHLHKITLLFTSVFLVLFLATFVLSIVLTPSSSSSSSGFIIGMKRLFRWHDANQLLRPQIWLDAATHSILAVGLMSGFVWVNAAHLRLRNNFKRDAVILTVHHLFSSLLALLICYTGIGAYYYHHNNSNNNDTTTTTTTIDNQQQQQLIAFQEQSLMETQFENLGPSFTFVALLGLFSSWTTNKYILGIVPIVFFGFFGLVQACCHVYNIVTAVNVLCHSRLPSLLRNNVFASGALCLFLLTFSHPFTTSTGAYLLQAMDDYVLPFVTLFLVVAELFLFAWIYSWQRVKQATTRATGKAPCFLWAILWRFISPCLGCFIFGAGLVTRIINPPQYAAYNSAAAAAAGINNNTTIISPGGASVMSKTSYPLQMVWMDVVLIALAILPIFILPLLRKCGIVIFPYSPLRTEYIAANSGGGGGGGDGSLASDESPIAPHRSGLGNLGSSGGGNGSAGVGNGSGVFENYNFPFIDASIEEVIDWELAQREQIMYETLHNNGNCGVGGVKSVSKSSRLNTKGGGGGGTCSPAVVSLTSAGGSSSNSQRSPFIVK